MTGSSRCLPHNTAARAALSVRLAGGALAVALSATGCGTHRAGGPAGAASGRPVRTVSASAGNGSAGGRGASAPPASATTAPPAPIAADGRHYPACADGTCEVAVSRSVRFAVRGGTLSLSKVKPGSSLGFRLTFAAGGGGSGKAEGHLRQSLRVLPGRRRQLCGPAGPPKRPSRVSGALSMQLAGWDSGNAAVLRLVSG